MEYFNENKSQAKISPAINPRGKKWAKRKKSDSGIISSLIKEGNYDICYNMDKA